MDPFTYIFFFSTDVSVVEDKDAVFQQQEWFVSVLSWLLRRTRPGDELALARRVSLLADIKVRGIKMFRV